MMDAKLMLVFTFTTIVVVTGYPSDPHTDIAAQQINSCGDCFHVTLRHQVRFCVKYCLSSKEYEYMKANKFRYSQEYPL